MNAFQSERFSVPYSDQPPVLAVATSEAAMRRAMVAVEASGMRVGAKLGIAEAIGRIADQASASAIWIEVDADGGADLDRLLQRVDADVRDGRYGAVVSTTRAVMEPVAALLVESGAELVVDGDDSERAAALAIATGWSSRRLAVADVASDRSAERLRQLSDEVSRIAATLARLSTGPASPAPAIEPMRGGDLPPLSVETVRSMIRARRLRTRYFAEDLFADPAWDMLLDLLQAELAHLRVPVSSLCIAAAVPATTALRWLKAMVRQGLFIRRADPHDGRRVFVELSPGASEAMHRYFGELGSAVAA